MRHICWISLLSAIIWLMIYLRIRLDARKTANRGLHWPLWGIFVSFGMSLLFLGLYFEFPDF